MTLGEETNVEKRFNNDLSHLKTNGRCNTFCKFQRKIDGGYSWIVTICAFLVQFILIGFMNNVSSLNTHWIKEFNLTEGSVSWIGSINAGAMFIFAPFVALIINKLGCQIVGVVGCVLCALGTLLTSFCDSFVVLLLSYGILFGIGISCCFFSSILIQTKYFDKRLALSNGIVTAGSGAGTFTISCFAHIVYNYIGWRATLRYYSLILFGLVIPKMFYNDLKINMKACFRTKENNTKTNRAKLNTWVWLSSTANDLCAVTLLRDIRFLIFTLACIFFMLGYFVPYIHLVIFAEKNGIEHDVASLLIGYMAISSLIGKLVTGKIAEIPCVSSVVLVIISFTMIGMAHIFNTISTNYIHFVLYSVVFGFFDGAYSCLVAVVIADLLGRENLGRGIGFLFGVKSIPFMCGGPLAGFLYDVTKSYKIPFMISGIFAFAAAYLLLIIPFYNLYCRKRQTYQRICTEYNLLIDEKDAGSKTFNEITEQTPVQNFIETEENIPLINNFGHFVNTQTFVKAVNESSKNENDVSDVESANKDNLSISKNSDVNVYSQVYNVNDSNAKPEDNIENKNEKFKDVDWFFEGNETSNKQENTKIYDKNIPTLNKNIDNKSNEESETEDLHSQL